VGALSDLFSSAHFQIVPHDDDLFYVCCLWLFQLTNLHLASEYQKTTPASWKANPRVLVFAT